MIRSKFNSGLKATIITYERTNIFFCSFSCFKIKVNYNWSVILGMKVILIAYQVLVIKIINNSWSSWTIFNVSSLPYFLNKKFVTVIILITFMRSCYSFFSFWIERQICFWNIIWKINKVGLFRYFLLVCKLYQLV